MSQLGPWVILALGGLCASTASARPVVGVRGPTRPAAIGVPASSDGALVLKRLESLAEEGPVASEDVAAILFAGGRSKTRALVEHMDQKAHGPGSVSAARRRVEAAIDRVPSIGARLLGTSSLKDGDALRVALVSLEILAARMDGAAAVEGFESLIRNAQGRAGAPTLGRSVEAVMARLADRGGLDGARLMRLVGASQPGLVNHVLQGAAKALAADAIAACLGRGTGVDAMILNQLQRAVQLGAGLDHGLVESNVTPFLQSPKAFERSEAALILGKVGVRADIEPLIAGLRDSSGLVRSSSLAALRQLTGMTIAGNHHRWTVWYDEQTAWWRGGGSTYVRALRSVPRTRLVSALATVASKRLYREEISHELIGMLRASRPDEVCAVLAALGSLRDPSAVPDIVGLRDHPSAKVRASASEALRSMRQAGIRVSGVASLGLDLTRR